MSKKIHRARTLTNGQLIAFTNTLDSLQINDMILSLKRTKDPQDESKALELEVILSDREKQLGMEVWTLEDCIYEAINNVVVETK